MNRFKIYVLGIMAFAIVALYGLYKYEKEERQRTQANQTALLEDIVFFKTKDSLNAASVQKLTLEIEEFRRYNGELNKIVESLGIKLRRLQSASLTAVVSEYKPETLIKDSIVYRDRQRPDTLKCLEYRDPWIDISGCFRLTDTKFTPQIITRDTINQVVYLVPRKFLFVKYGTKAIRQTVVVNNPWSAPVYTEYIELKRR